MTRHPSGTGIRRVRTSGHGARRPACPLPWLLAGALASGVGLRAEEPPDAAAAAVQSLQEGAGQRRPLKPGETHVWALPMEAGEFARVAVAQDGIDVQVRVSDPAGVLLTERDSPTGVFGTETASAIAARSGEHRVEVRGLLLRTTPGAYEIRILARRPATESDRQRIAAEKLWMAGNRAAADFGPEARRREVEGLLGAASLWEAVGDSAQAAAALAEASASLLFRGGGLERARVIQQRGLADARLAGDAHVEINLLRQAGFNRALQGDLVSAIDLFTESVDLAIRARDTYQQAESRDGRGWVYGLSGRYQEALDDHQTELDSCRRNGDVTLEPWAWNGLGLVAWFLGEHSRALTSLERAAILFEKVGNVRGEALARQNAGLVYGSIDLPEEALREFGRALASVRRMGDRSSEALILVNSSLMRLALNDVGGARQNAEAALPLARGVRDRRVEMSALMGVGRVDLSDGRAEKARAAFEQAAAIGLQAGARDYAARALGLRARAERALERPEEALRSLEKALDLLESVRGGVAAREARASFLSARQDLYRDTVGLLLELSRLHPGGGDDERAFLLSERARARALAEAIAGARTDRAVASPGMTRRELEADARIASLQKELRGRDLSIPERRRKADDLARAEEEFDRIQVEIEKTDPQAARLASSRPAGISDVRKVLGPDGALVSYFAAGDEMIAFLVTPDRFAAVRLPVSAGTAGARARNLAELLEKGDDTSGILVGARLDQELVAPIRGLISPAVTRLVIVPDGALHTIPFEALSRSNGSQRRLLLEDWTISYSPSATVLVALSQPQPPAPTGKDLIVFADPDLGRAAGGGDRDLWRSYEEEGLSVGALPHTAQEARRIARVVGSAEVRTGAAASERQAKQERLDRFRILHFATHGLASERHPARSALVLAVGENDPEDGLLQAREIARLRLASDLVVLSGCRTGRGRLLSGEGVLGLARAFFAAGSRAVVASLWDVHDERTARFMEAFYRRLSAGASKGEALRQAKLESLRRGGEAASPRDWAAFVLIGDAGGAVALSPARKRIPWTAIAFAAAIATALALLAPRLLRQGSRGAAR